MVGTLAFLLTVAVCLAALVYALVALVRGRRGAAAKAVLFVVAWVAVYAVILVAVSLTSRGKTMALGEEHCFDEMCFAVMDASTTPTLGAHQATGTYFVEIIRLRNAGRGKPQRPSSLRMWMRDANGREYHEVLLGDPPGAGQPTDPSLLFPTPLQPGQTDVGAVAFDLPRDVPESVLVIQEGAGFPTDVIIGDENSFLHAKTTYRLTRSR